LNDQQYIYMRSLLKLSDQFNELKDKYNVSMCSRDVYKWL